METNWKARGLNVKLNRTEDYGPVTKVIPTLALETKPNTVIVVIDDDWNLETRKIDNMLKYLTPDNVITGRGWIVGNNCLHPRFWAYVTSPDNLTEVSVVGGCCGFATYRKTSRPTEQDLQTFINELPKMLQEKCAFFHDDVVLSAYFESNCTKKYVSPITQ